MDARCLLIALPLTFSCSSSGDGAESSPTMPSPQASDPTVSEPPDTVSADEPIRDSPVEPGKPPEPKSLPPPPSGNVHSESIVVLDVPPGAEESVCVYKELPNTADWKVVEVQSYIGDGSHHLMVDRTATGTVSHVPAPCGHLQGSTTSRLLISQQHETAFKLPDGVAFTLEPKQFLTLQIHYINSTQDVIDVEGRVDLILAPEGTGADFVEAQQTFTGSIRLDLQPHERTVEGAFHPMSGTPSNPAHMFALTSHTHSLGVRTTIERTTGDGVPGELLHESLDWAEPPLTTFASPIVFTGDDGLALTCEYENTRDEAVSGGTRFLDEMCFMWLYWYQEQ